MFGVGTLRRVVSEITCDVAAARDRDPAAREEMAGKRVVTIAADGGERYMSLPFFEPE